MRFPIRCSSYSSPPSDTSIADYDICYPSPKERKKKIKKGEETISCPDMYEYVSNTSNDVYGAVYGAFYNIRNLEIE